MLGLVYKCCSNLLLFSYWHFAWLSYLLLKVEYWRLLILCFLKKFISKIFIFGRAGSSLLPKGFLKLWWAGRFSSCGAWAAFVAEHGVPGCARSAVPALGLSGSRAGAQELWRTGRVALRHVGSSQTGNWTHEACIGWWILNHESIREILHFLPMWWPHVHSEYNFFQLYTHVLICMCLYT